jgi:hypothetical protein
MVKNEEDMIAEWIAFHFAIGFDAVIVLDNLSTDDTWGRAEQCERFGTVLIESWRHSSADQQMLGYDYVCRRYATTFDWIAFVDCDELVVSADQPPIQSLLSAAGDASAIALQWLMFGSSGHVAKPATSMIQTFTYRARTDFPPNEHVKSIVRPARVVRAINQHAFEVEGRYVDYRGEAMIWKFPGCTQRAPATEPLWRVQHYFTRSHDHWLEKLARGYGPDPTVRTIAEFNHYDRNEVEDRSAVRWLAPVQAMLQEIGSVTLARR